MTLWTVAGVGIHILVILRILTRPHRQPASRIAWIIVVLVFPLLGLLAYINIGEVNIGRSRVRKLRKIIENMPSFPQVVPEDEVNLKTNIPELYSPLFAVGESINGFPVVGGNRAELLADSNASIDRMVADIDAAKEHVHLSFYICCRITMDVK